MVCLNMGDLQKLREIDPQGGLRDLWDKNLSQSVKDTYEHARMILDQEAVQKEELADG